MGRTGINFACAHSGAIGPELTGELVRHECKSAQAHYGLGRIPPLWCPTPRPVFFFFLLLFVEFSGGFILYTRSQRLGNKSRGEQQAWMRRIANLFREGGPAEDWRPDQTLRGIAYTNPPARSP